MTELRHRTRLTPEKRAEMDAFEERVSLNGAYLGGVFEAGGWLGASINRGVVRGRKYAYGYLKGSLNDNDEATVNVFQELLGGRKYHEKGDNSWTLRISTDRIPSIASAMADYAPSRRDFIALAQLWEEMSIDERIEFVTEFRTSLGSGGRTPVSTADYEQLICLPGFLAGVVDARGKLEQVRRHDIERPVPYPSIRIGSPNKALLDALQPKYGGSVNERITGTKDKKGVTFDVFLSHRKAFGLYQICRPNLLIKQAIGDTTFARYL